MSLPMPCVTGANHATLYGSSQYYRTHLVILTGTVGALCLPDQHNVQVVHHYGAGEIHYCPTMFISCEICGAVGMEPAPYACQRWGV